VLYPALLFLHSILRWLVLVAGVATVVGALRHKPGRAFVAFVGLLDMQLVVGLVLYLTASPQTKIALGNFGAAMKDGELRFWAVEHPTMMLVAIILAHVGRAMSKRAKDDARRDRLTLVFASIALVILLVAIPWPFSHHARPFIPSF
jgi:hypothetical protein